MLISVGGREGAEARCLISSMSAKPVYVLKVVATVTDGDGQWSSAITDYSVPDDRPGASPELVTRQGPLMTGQWRDIGSFRDLLQRALERHDGRSGAGVRHLPTSLELTVVAIYNAEELPVAARRRFSYGDAQTVRPALSDTVPIRRRRERRRLLETCQRGSVRQ